MVSQGMVSQGKESTEGNVRWQGGNSSDSAIFYDSEVFCST